MAKRRPLQVGATIQRELQSRLARGLADPRIKGLITVTKVEMTEDLSIARVFVSVMPTEHENITLHGLKAATKKLRRDVADRIRIKDMPQFQFVIDRGLHEQQKIMELLNRDRIEREERELARAEQPRGEDPK
ncbi:MAG: 30S ribosome-binding factor RbfA [Phycisphaerales bacterium]|nr:30S ribosome-binding factor RbfA [Phycisphaerales bacterium]